MRLRTVLASALAILPGSAGVATNGWHWTLLGDDVLPYLIFQDAARERNRFILMCDNQRRDAEVTVPEADRKARRGTPVTVELIAGARTLTLKGRIATDNGVYGHVKKAPYRAVIEVLREPGPVTVRMNGNSYELAERGRAMELASFTQSCKLR